MLTGLLLLTALKGNVADPLAAGFTNPPASARPHTWWHWMNGNVTKAGITADLEAMKQAGIGGAQMFTVDQEIPAGPAKYGGPLWRELTAFAVKEAARLGIELCIHNCAGWSSSGGPWVKPEDAMQVLAWSSVNVTGPKTFSETLPPIAAPRVYARVPYSKDIAVYAYRTPKAGDVVSPRPPDFLGKTGVERADGLKLDLTPLKQDIAIPAGDLVMLTEKMDENGHLTWNVPEGNWTILRMGHVPTGKDNHPAPPEGDGLEVDKMSKEAFDRHWSGLVGKVLSDIGPKGTKTLNNVLIDSYEVGSQNWTPKFREDFRRLRGYDPMPYLPVIAERIIENKEKSERFLWDLRRTIADLFATEYYGRAATLAHQNGMLFSTEPYGNGGFDAIQAGGESDVPMGEFWLGGAAMGTTKLAASVGHIYGRRVIGAESFTADVMPGRWREEPAAMKTLGDLAFCNGINRYIFHRYAMQPWTNFKPGMTMGPWGTHLERTQTWWTEAGTWLKYVARCQYLLQAGTFQADICCFYGEDAPNDLSGRGDLLNDLHEGYDYDGCDADALMKMTVKNGRVVLPSGMSYRLLKLPESPFMTPRIARKIKELVLAGASVYGPKPTQSPSLTGYPACDDEVRNIADELWGIEKGMILRKVGKGQVIYGHQMGNVMAAILNTQPDVQFTPTVPGMTMASIHRKAGNADIYFVSNQKNKGRRVMAEFRVGDRIPELWHPETGKIEEAAAFETNPGSTTVPLELEASESVFVIFRKPANKPHLESFSPMPAIEETSTIPSIEIASAFYGSEDGRGTDVTDKVRALVRRGFSEIPASNTEFGDPVVNVVKRLTIEFRVNGKSYKQTVGENESIELVPDKPGPLSPLSYWVRKVSDKAVEFVPWKSGIYYASGPNGERHQYKATNPFVPVTLTGAWNLRFAPNLGAPATAKFDKLISWSDHTNPGIKYFSGSATYTKEFTVPAAFLGNAIRLNLGDVKNFATVTLNGKPLGVLWKPPFSLDVSNLVHKGTNRLEVKVTNLWPNRLIGDEQLPPDVEWDGRHLKKWPEWLVEGKPRPKTGRITFATTKYYDKNSPLLPSGLLGPVTLSAAKRITIKL